jgi:hypothetical protein
MMPVGPREFERRIAGYLGRSGPPLVAERVRVRGWLISGCATPQAGLRAYGPDGGRMDQPCTWGAARHGDYSRAEGRLADVTI